MRDPVHCQKQHNRWSTVLFDSLFKKRKSSNIAKALRRAGCLDRKAFHFLKTQAFSTAPRCFPFRWFEMDMNTTLSALKHIANILPKPTISWLRPLVRTWQPSTAMNWKPARQRRKPLGCCFRLGLRCFRCRSCWPWVFRISSVRCPGSPGERSGGVKAGGASVPSLSPKLHIVRKRSGLIKALPPKAPLPSGLRGGVISFFGENLMAVQWVLTVRAEMQNLRKRETST